ncbi:MAG: hypothetical protein UV74_C0013G0372 [Candidatus Woesebacteria bacterium GW2011_GWB1_43_14]|uniref:Glycosyltransferase RgtA/B/C/D-like domain-containing protein n=1 Tax=Candidatus Woesebacteria bacterium GW2011_GWB1_43_14 TaxID=1618578 RepID=A0A0G1DHB3_9BACT|nr:MAG: hypothetical protein UT21_C0001G0082 [Candidatus Woesebacteria bacterium GW2011_GWA1_39_11b]KKS78332.1 MAG: hypothetical protein UV51_C0001G0048 [Candidatus Woesebacteria bacterium GW2011_GWC1_42_9]KKS97250.1 MAG: hypothetical protein UV74_C0013G0372 [Candidatus Woesebacteria bacterium GW2011_GWB1_43_14]
MKKISLKKIFLFAFLFRLIFAFWIWHPDLNNHIDWGIRFWDYGAKGFYAPESNVWNYTWPNQPPGTIIIFAFIYKLFKFIFSFFWFLNIKIPLFPSLVMLFLEDRLYPALLQLPAILSDLGMAYLIYKILVKWKNVQTARFGAILFLFNPIIWYNSAVWGQTDATVNFFGLLALYFLLNKKLTKSLLAIAISLYIKVSLAIFLPLFAIVIVRQRHKVINIVKSLSFPVLIILGVTLFFSTKVDPATWLYNIYTKKVLTEQLQVITANAFNLWAALTGIHEQPHILKLGPLSYQYWGMVLTGLVLAPIFWKLWRNQDKENIFWSFVLLAFSVWMFKTNMHERYLYPLFPYLTILVARDRKLLPIYWSLSGINLLNLYNFWWVPKVDLLVGFLSFGNRVMPRILGLINLVIFVYLARSRRLFHPNDVS